MPNGLLQCGYLELINLFSTMHTFNRDVSASSLSLISVVIIGSSEVWLRLGIHLGLETLSHGS